MSARTILKHLYEEGRMTREQYEKINRNLKEPEHKDCEKESDWIDDVRNRVSNRRKEVARCMGTLDEYQMFRVDVVVYVPGENATSDHIKELIDDAFMSFVSGKAATNDKEGEE